jgi:hypothetical protein
MSYDDKNPEHRKMVEEYLTRPKPSDQNVIVANNEITTEKDFKKSLPIEDQPDYNPDKDPNLFRRIKYYQGESLGPEFDRAIIEEDKALKKLGRDPANILQRNKNVTPLYPKRATVKQMTDLKAKMDKYKQTNGNGVKEMKKPKVVSEANKAYAETVAKALFETAQEVARKNFQKEKEIQKAQQQQQLNQQPKQTPIYDDPKMKNTPFASDSFYRRWTSKGRDE